MQGEQSDFCTDEETGYARRVAHAQPRQNFILLLWINQLQLIVINSRFFGFMISAVAGINHVWLTVCDSCGRFVAGALAFFQRYRAAGTCNVQMQYVVYGE